MSNPSTDRSFGRGLAGVIAIGLFVMGLFGAGTVHAAATDTRTDATSITATTNTGPATKTAERTLTVGIKIAPPFVMQDDDGQLSGLSIALWEAVATRLGFATHYVRTDLPGLFSGLENGSLDVAVAALTVTEPRETRIDFSYPFYTTGLAIAVPAGGGHPVWVTLARFVSWPFLTALAALTGLLLAVGVLVWLFERRRNPNEFGGSALSGLASGFWWAAVTMTTVGYGDKSPRSLGGRLVGLVWMFTAVLVISSFTAAIATSLTVGSLSTGVRDVSDLKSVRVLTVGESAAAQALTDRGIAYGRRASLDAALDALVQGQADAVVYDAPLLKYSVRTRHDTRVTVLDSIFDRQDYAFALPQGSALREPINRAILSELNTDAWNRRVKQLVGVP